MSGHFHDSDGQQTVDTAEPIAVHPIGFVRSPHKQGPGTPIQGVFAEEFRGVVELMPQYASGLRDLDQFSHAILLYHFHRSDSEQLVARPYLEDVEHGIFAIRSPHRPNHIGLSVVRIERIEGNELHFSEVDILDGTPVLDVKPYVKHFDCRENAVSGWVEKHFENGRQPHNRVAPPV